MTGVRSIIGVAPLMLFAAAMLGAQTPPTPEAQPPSALHPSPTPSVRLSPTPATPAASKATTQAVPGGENALAPVPGGSDNAAKPTMPGGVTGADAMAVTQQAIAGEFQTRILAGGATNALDVDMQAADLPRLPGVTLQWRPARGRQMQPCHIDRAGRSSNEGTT